jgi:TonB family protein
MVDTDPCELNPDRTSARGSDGDDIQPSFVPFKVIKWKDHLADALPWVKPMYRVPTFLQLHANTVDAWGHYAALRDFGRRNGALPVVMELYTWAGDVGHTPRPVFPLVRWVCGRIQSIRPQVANRRERMGPNPNRWIVVWSLSLTLPAFAQFQPSSPGKTIEDAAHASAAAKSETPGSPVQAQVLSDTKGFRLQPYLDLLLPQVRNSWYSAVSDLVKQPDRRHGKVVAEFVIARSGEVQDLQIVDSSGEKDLDDAVREGLKRASPVRSLPEALSLNELHMRFHFYYKGGKASRWWKRR